MTPDHLGGLSIITWSLSVLIIEGGKPERQRKHGEGSGGGQAGGRRPGAAEASGSYKGRGVPPLELPRDPFGACDLQDHQVINPACFQPLGLRSFGTVAVENEHTLLYLESQLLSGAPHGPPPITQQRQPSPTCPPSSSLCCGAGPGDPTWLQGPGDPARARCARARRGPLLVCGHPASLPPSLGDSRCGWGYPGAVRPGVACSPGQPGPGRWPHSRALNHRQGPPEVSRHLLHSP